MNRIRLVGSVAVYHCMMRISGGAHLLGVREKEVLRRMLWAVADFSGVEVLTYCIMSNHFHILVRIPAKGVGHSREELLRRYARVYASSNSPRYPNAARMQCILAGADETAEAWERRLSERMEDVSEFMKTLNQRFSNWYNKTHTRFGTLWAGRFKSVLVEDAQESLQIVAAYIDLNPVRAGICRKPEDYRWSGYSEAIAGEESAQLGLMSTIGLSCSSDALAAYRMILFGKGYHGREGEQGRIPPEQVKQVLTAGGKVSVSELIRCRVRYLKDGAVIGSKAFVQGLSDSLPSVRRTRFKRLPLSSSMPIYSLRNLQKQPFD